MSRLRLDVGELYRALDRRRAVRGINWNQVADETGLSAPFFSRLKREKGLSVDALCTLLAWLGDGYALPFTKAFLSDN